MKTYQTEKSKFEAYMAPFIPGIEKPLYLAAADYSGSCEWITESFLLVSGRPVVGICKNCSYAPHEIPLEYRPLTPPPIEKELATSIDLAEANLITSLFKEDRELCRDFYFASPRPRQHLDEKDIVLVYLQGTFKDAFREVCDSTQCSALKDFLTDILRIPPFRIT